MKPLMVRNISQPRESRETFISLRACRSAIRIARGVIFRRPIDVGRVRCEGCGEMVDCTKAEGLSAIDCPYCGRATPVPEYLRGNRKANREETIPDSPYDDPEESRSLFFVSLFLIVLGLCLFCLVLAFFK